MAGAFSELDRVRASAKALDAHSIFQIVDSLRCSLSSDAELTDRRVLHLMSELRRELQTAMWLTTPPRR